jgi:polyphosphate kinase
VLRRMLVAPFERHNRLLRLIERECDNARRGLPARIIAKMNSLVVTGLIDALCAASQAGVRVDLIVRGICCLRPGIPGWSENIRVRSIVGRFLEHSRVFYFANAGQAELYVGSADWMPRNLFKRIEVVFPILDGRLREQLVRQLLEVQLADNVKARRIQPDGTHVRVERKPGETLLNSQEALIERARRVGQTPAASGPRPATPQRLTPLKTPPAEAR